MNQSDQDKDNFYATDINGVEKHISQVERGKLGYWCTACKGEMIAVKGEWMTQHFRHVAHDIQHRTNCTYSDETYRHKLAKEILQRLKKIKVPSIKKYPPNGVEGLPVLLKEAHFVTAYRVENELSFYEDINGQVAWGRDINFDTELLKELIIRPDVSFFDQNNTPILLIEIVATHKVDANKLLKIKRLGIDTVEITIPKDTPQEIEKTFLHTYRTEWLYNHEQEQTKYVRLPLSTDKRIQSPDEFQARVFGATESYECRKTQISHLIRRTRKVLESKPYLDTERYLSGEIRRLERLQKRHQAQLELLDREASEQVKREFESEVIGLDRTQSELDQETGAIEQQEREFEERHAGLESRYNQKRTEQVTALRNYRATCSDQIDAITARIETLGGSGITANGILRKIRELEETIIRETERIKHDYEQQLERGIQIANGRKRLTAIQSESYRQAQEQFEADRKQLSDRFDRIRATTALEIKSRNSSNPRLASDLERILQLEQFIRTIRYCEKEEGRIIKAKAELESGAYKSWYRP